MILKKETIEKRKRCPNGTRKHPKTRKCVKKEDITKRPRGRPRKTLRKSKIKTSTIKSKNTQIEYLKNDICNFYFLNPNHYDNKNGKNIFSMTFFKMDNHYKNFEIYLKGLDRWIKFLETNKPNFVIRLFIDQNILNDETIMKKILFSKYIEPVLFTCKDYMNIKGFHIDLFGTLVRFFPAFNFPNNDAKKVICVDIDLKNEDFRKIELMMNKKNLIDKYLTGMVSITGMLYNNTQPHIFAGCFYTGKSKYDKKIILDFIKDPEIKMINKTDINYGTRENKYSYGVDEIFLNTYWIKKMDKIQSIIHYTPAYFVYHSKETILKNKNSEKIFKLILGKYYTDNMNLKYMMSFFDKQFYNKVEFDKKEKYIAKRFYKVIHEFFNNNEIWFEKNIMQMLDKYFYNVLICDAVYTIDTNTFDYNVKLYNAKKLSNKMIYFY